MGESLEKLVNNLPKDDFKCMTMNCSIEKLPLLLRKEIFPMSIGIALLALTNDYFLLQRHFTAG